MPYPAARNSGVAPLRLRRSTSAPASIRAAAAARLRQWIAWRSGVQPFLRSRRSGSAPASSSRPTISGSARRAARWIGAQPSPPKPSGSASACSSSALTASRSFSTTAAPSAVGSPGSPQWESRSADRPASAAVRARGSGGVNGVMGCGRLRRDRRPALEYRNEAVPSPVLAGARAAPKARSAGHSLRREPGGIRGRGDHARGCYRPPPRCPPRLVPTPRPGPSTRPTTGRSPPSGGSR